MELRGVKYKLAKLEASINNMPFESNSFKVDSIPKMMGMMTMMMGMFLVVPMFALKMAGLGIMTMVKISIVLIFVAEVITTAGYNGYHKQIGQLNNDVDK